MERMDSIYSHLRLGLHRVPSSLETHIEQCIKDYNKPGNAKKFEENAKALSYRAPVYCARLLAEILVDKIKQAKILDIASGPGQVGTELHKVGFRNVHALDGSWAMLEACRKKNVYTDYLCSIVDEDRGLPVDDGIYDAVITSGAVLEHHLPPTSQAEFARAAKAGGYCVIAYGTDVMMTEYGKAWQAESVRLELEHVWKSHCKIAIPDFYVNMPGEVDIFRVL
ncbi:Methyltransferase-like protein 27 [Bulinus truncatus]|nr:Methyltransferase-like protein 27 [Bulinus truncatus]